MYLLKFYKKNHLFHFNNLEIEIEPNVYDPSEDSFLLLEFLKFSTDQKILEIGTGCGLISLEACRRGANVICTDINLFAVKLTKKNIENNKHILKGTIEVRKGDLFSVIRSDELFDLIIFNPPYLPTTKKEKIDKWFDLATDGGNDGQFVIKRFIKDVKKYLNSSGRAYFIFSSLSNRKKLEDYLKEKSFTYNIVHNRRFDDETLDVYCIY